jgi:hypothetical protein
MAGISQSHVSRLCAEIDEHGRTFLERPIRRLALSLDRRDLHEGARGWLNRLGRRNHCGRRQQ